MPKKLICELNLTLENRRGKLPLKRQNKIGNIRERELSKPPVVRIKKWIFSSLLLLTLAVVVGCQSIGYYKQAISGEMQLLLHKQSIPELVKNPGTPSKLKQKLELILALRDFAKDKLRLPIDKDYLTYVDLHRSNAVWNVYAAPELSLKPKMWWYPVVGSVTYRGYFSEKKAESYAAKLRKKGLDVYVGGVDAYSTLGWFKDPVLNTFIDESDRQLAGLIFHELTHQRLFIAGDTEFNEALATAVSEEGVRRWLTEKNDSAGLEKYRVQLHRKKQFVDLISDTREQLEKIYGDDESAKDDSPEIIAQKRREKQKVIEQLRANYVKLKAEWGGYSGYDEWFDGPLNNAKLNTVATYYDLVPAFHELIARNNGNLEKFFAQMKKLSHVSKKKRHRILDNVTSGGRDSFFAAPQSRKAADLPVSKVVAPTQSPAISAR
jgi:predicted aminopeptidase